MLAISCMLQSGHRNTLLKFNHHHLQIVLTSGAGRLAIKNVWWHLLEDLGVCFRCDLNTTILLNCKTHQLKNKTQKENKLNTDVVLLLVLKIL